MPLCEDICLWADGTWCYWEELERMSHMSDDYELIAWDSPRAEEIVNG